MKMRHVLTRLSLVLLGACVVVATTVVTAQAPSSASTRQRAANAQSVTVTGCVQPENSVLKRTPAAGSMGLEDQFVVTFATLNPGAGTELPKADVQAPPAPVGTSASSGFGRVYRLTGHQQKDLENYVGQRIEIIGHFRDKETLKDELGSIGTTGRTGDLTSANTPEIIVDSFTVAGGTCTPGIR